MTRGRRYGCSRVAISSLISNAGNNGIEELKMRSSVKKQQSKKRSKVLVGLICAIVTVSALTSVTSTSVANTQPLMVITVTNNSAREMHHLYLSPVDHDAWGPDLLAEGITLKPGETFTISEASCSGNEIKVIAEDKQGCFVYGLVGCSQASTGWAITDATPPDCGN